MLFNSYEFVFFFLPFVVILFYLLGSKSRWLAFYFLIAASLFYYACWRPVNLLIIGPSVIINYLLVSYIIRNSEAKPGKASFLFWLGILFNIAFIGYFKYRNFFLEISNDVVGTSFVFDNIILPLGISFITFQKIGLLVDAKAGRVSKVTFREYALFVLFFPQLIAGPIVHFREMMPQFETLLLKPRANDFSVGLTLFFSGLFKKVVLADTIAGLIAPYWQAAIAGQHPLLMQSWAAALGYMLQLYFDFSGYSDMAIGAARLFGVKLPYNFDSPLKATSIIEYWSRWHVTLTRFLTAYIFNPITLNLTRRRIARGLPANLGRRATPGSFATLLAFPTLVTMFASGVWHGAGYQFLVFGILHGLALVVNHAWRIARPHYGPGAEISGQAIRFGYWALTFLFVISVEVFFRAPSVTVALDVLSGMADLHGISLPLAELHRIGPHLARVGIHVSPAFESGTAFIQVWAMIAVGLMIVLGLPNNYEMLANYSPALGFKPRVQAQTQLLRLLSWRPTRAWAVWGGLLGAIALLSLGRLSDFLYWHF